MEPVFGTIQPFTYIKDHDGYIYCVKDVKQDGVSAALVYVPDKKGDRIQDGIRYRKVVANGLQHEMPFLKTTLSDQDFRKLSAKFIYYSDTTEQILFIDFQDMQEIYSPKGSLNNILSGSSTNISERSRQKILSVIGLFNDNSVPIKSLGFYGSLQCNIVKINGEIDDIDILIDGTKHYDLITRLSKDHEVNKNALSHIVASSPFRLKAAIRRGQLSQFKIPNFDDTVCDVRIIRTEQFVTPDLYRVTSKQFRQIDLEDAVVIDASESLSLPFRYKITHGNIEYQVIGKHYYYLAAAGIGDRVNLRGSLVQPGVIAIIDPDSDFICQDLETLHG